MDECVDDRFSTTLHASAHGTGAVCVRLRHSLTRGRGLAVFQSSATLASPSAASDGDDRIDSGSTATPTRQFDVNAAGPAPTTQFPDARIGGDASAPIGDDSGTASLVDRSTSPSRSSPPSPAVPADTSFITLGETTVAAHLPDPVCAAGTGPVELTAFFDAGRPLLGADYQRPFALPDGRVLWLFQDAFLPTSHGPELVHNVGLLQSGRCFQLLRSGSTDAPASYILANRTDRFVHWFWPLGGGIGLDGRLNVFVAEMREHGPGYLVHTEPVATWLVSIELDTLTVDDVRLAPNPSNELYGWSVVSQGEFTYLYAHCYRQFGWDLFPFADPPFRAHDFSCGPDVTVARVPRSDFEALPDYWDGTGWTAEESDAAPVIPREGRAVNPSQITLFEGRFVAVTKVGDWWGDTIYLDVAAVAEGPWHTYATVTVAPGDDDGNTYFASIVPYGADETSFVVGISRNTWSGDDPDHYSPMFIRIPAPDGDAPIDARFPAPVAD